jgi:hypothetical protein
MAGSTGNRLATPADTMAVNVANGQHPEVEEPEGRRGIALMYNFRAKSVYAVSTFALLAAAGSLFAPTGLDPFQPSVIRGDPRVPAAPTGLGLLPP